MTDEVNFLGSFNNLNKFTKLLSGWSEINHFKFIKKKLPPQLTNTP